MDRYASKFEEGKEKKVLDKTSLEEYLKNLKKANDILSVYMSYTGAYQKSLQKIVNNITTEIAKVTEDINKKKQ